MKYLVASDIHGSAYYCKKVLEAFKKEQADYLLLLGDILYHGPRNILPKDYAPKEVAAMLNDMADKIFCVRGNCDAEVDQMVLSFPIMADYCLLDAGGKMVFATHGHVWNTSNLPPLAPGTVLLHGHTHVPVCEEGRVICMNPGSTSLPKENSVHGYMTIEGNRFIWKNLESGEAYREYCI